MKEVDLGGNHIDDECMKALGEYIQSNTSIEVVSLDSNVISDKGIEILVPYLVGSKSLKKINVSSNKAITNDSIPLLMKIIESSHIESMMIYETSITSKNIFIIPTAHNVIKYGTDRLIIEGWQV